MNVITEDINEDTPWAVLFSDDLVLCDEDRESLESSLENWTQLPWVRLKSLKLSKRIQGTIRIDLAVSDRFNNESKKSLLLNVEQGR